QVTRVKLEECGQYKTCSQCLGSHDPYCGWCTFEKRCTVKKTCTGDNTALSWLSYGKAQCTKIVSVIPQQVQVQKDRAKMLTMTIQNLPLPQRHEYECAFSGYGVSRTTTAVLLGNSQQSINHTVQCETPNSNLLPVIPTGQDHVMMRLSVRMNGKDFVSSNLTFFDCSLHSSCTSCTNSDYPCTWCIRTPHERQCVFDRERCNNDVLVTGKSVEGATDRPGPEFCPRIESSFTKILVPSGTEKQVKVKAIHLEVKCAAVPCIILFPQ
ncbi:Plexin-B, partial [Lamellibrachia satsuma]